MEIRYLILCLTTRCNLSCAHCYHGGDVQGTDMPETVLSEALQMADGGSAPLHVQLTGGEPTLAPKLVTRAVRSIRDFARPVTIGLQTNGTLVTGELADFLRQHQVQVGVSLDGPPAVHENLRGMTAETLKGLSLLESRRLPFRVTTVVSRKNVGHLDRLVLTLAGFQSARGIGLDLLVKKGRADAGGPLPASPSELRTGILTMLKTLSAVNARRQVPLTLRELELLGRAPSPESTPGAFCHAALGRSLAVHPDGRLYPCGQLLGTEKFAAGTIRAPLPEKLTRLADFSLVSETCRGCPLNGRCPGDCPSRIYHNRGPEKGLTCVLYQTLWENAPCNLH